MVNVINATGIVPHVIIKMIAIHVKKDITLTLTKNFALFVGLVVEIVPIQIGVKNVKMDITYLQGNVTNVTNHAKHVIIQVYVHLA